jgi:two-component system, NarL family, sensor histidine kinase DegS
MSRSMPLTTPLTWLRSRSDIARRLAPYAPRWQSRQFWAVQILVVVIAIAHQLFEAANYSLNASSRPLELSFVPTAFFFIPAIYAALNFGIVGAIATAAWCVVISLPNMIVFRGDQDWLADLVQLVAVSTTTFFVGQRTDREVAARHRAELAIEALRSEESLRQAGLRAYAANILRAQEAERQRIARELHDQTVQELVLLCRQIDLVESAGDASPVIVQGMSAARQAAEKIAADLRHFARTLRPPTLDDLGLVTAVRGLVADLNERAKIDGDVTVVGDERRMPDDVELAVFRITQEALRNVERHATASHVAVTIRFTERALRVDIVDDGTGFAMSPSADFAAMGHLGLLGMRERAETVGGELAIQSRPGEGTRVQVAVSDPLADLNPEPKHDGKSKSNEVQQRGTGRPADMPVDLPLRSKLNP